MQRHARAGVGGDAAGDEPHLPARGAVGGDGRRGEPFDVQALRVARPLPRSVSVSSRPAGPHAQDWRAAQSGTVSASASAVSRPVSPECHGTSRMPVAAASARSSAPKTRSAAVRSAVDEHGAVEGVGAAGREVADACP